MENPKNTGDTAVQPRYKEKEIIRSFLKSEKGFQLLLQIGRKYKYGSAGDTVGEIDGLIDVFSTWTTSFPVRKNLKISKYDFLKHIEVFCTDKENVEGLEEIFKN